jgi:predicted transport protein
MPLFAISNDALISAEQTNFALEKELQHLIEKNLGTVFNCRFIATEFSTGTLHGGRIDSLALSEDDNPVIIEYKKVESSELITQSLYYLHWIHDHRGDFEIAARQKLGNSVTVDWSNVRVICLAPKYKKFDLHAVQAMGANIELWRYRLFSNQTIYLEEVLQSERDTVVPTGLSTKNPVMVEAGKKAAISRKNGDYSFDDHLEGRSENVKALMQAVREFVLNMDESIEEVPKKYWIAYKTSQNVVCIEPQQKNIKLFVKLRAKDVQDPPDSYRDVTDIGHFGTGDSEFTISSVQEFESVAPYIELAYNKLGG